MNSTTGDQSPLQFPCEFPIKAVGHNNAQFKEVIIQIVQRHASDLDCSLVRATTSHAGKYQSVTVTVNATSRAQLDAIYQDLCDCVQVIMAL